jgi:hypothetical protein
MVRFATGKLIGLVAAENPAGSSKLYMSAI